jgi:hypothetical protein
MGSIPRRLPHQRAIPQTKLGRVLDGIDLFINVLALPFVIAYAVSNIFSFVTGSISKFPAMVQQWHYRALFSASLFFLGSLLWLLKKHAVRFYATLEFGVAFAIAYKTFIQVAADMQALNLGIGIAASLFLFVRGYENLEKAKSQAHDLAKNTDYANNKEGSSNNAFNPDAE